MSDDELIELWHERAAIRQYDGETPRERAEFLAVKDVERINEVVPATVRAAALASREKSMKNDC